MGAKLTKSKSVFISGKTKKQQKEITTTVENTNNHLDMTTNEDNKQIKKKIKKKKEQKLNKKSSKTKVDKSTNTENYVLQASPFTEQLVGDQVSTINNNLSLDTSTAQVNAAYQPETPNNDVNELRDVCVRSGIISAGFRVGNQQTLNEQEYQTNAQNIIEESTKNASVTVVANIDQAHTKKQ